MITRIEAYRYRCFERLQLDVDGYQVLVGRNGAGKSTLLDIPVLLSEMLTGQSVRDVFLKPTPSHCRARADGGQDLVFKRSGDWFVLALHLRLPAEVASRVGVANARYELAFGVDGSALHLSQEALILFDELPDPDDLPEGMWAASHLVDGKSIRLAMNRERDGRTEIYQGARTRGKHMAPAIFETPPDAPALAYVPPDEDRHPAATYLRAMLRSEFTLYQPSVDALRTAQPSPGAGFKIAPDASTLAWSILDLAGRDSAGLEEWNEHVSTVLPGFAMTEARKREDDGFAYLRVHYRNGMVIPGHGLSDGTLAVLAYTILPFLPNAPRFLAIEEPENGVHPKAIEAILETLQAMDDSQVWVTSHSPIVAAVTELSDLLCLSLSKSGAVEVVPGDRHALLAHWHGTPSLGTLHSAGVL